jgi:hypothetical protein
MNTENHNSLRSARRISRIVVPRISVQSLMHTFSSTSAFLIVPVFAMIGFGGCPKQPVKPKFVQVGVTQPPRMPVLDIDSTPPDVTLPELPYWAPQTSSALSNPPRPPAPRRATNTTEPEPEQTKPEAPQISPQLSAEEKARAQTSIDVDVHAAQQALDTASHHTLNAAQQDMADKIRSFITQTQDAVAVSDFLSAKNLAQKAHVLSNELIRSF